MKLIVTTNSEHQQYDPSPGNHRTKCALRVFIEDDRPILNGDIAGDFNWRRTIDYSDLAAHPDFKEHIRAWLSKNYGLDLDLDEVSIKFSQYAGCAMCPCSPGLLVNVEGISPRRNPPAIYVEVTSEDSVELAGVKKSIK
jgi:hypothetical protein